MPLREKYEVPCPILTLYEAQLNDPTMIPCTSNGKRSVCEMIVKKLFFNMLSIGYIDTNNTFWSYFTVKQGGFGSLARKKDD